MSNLNAAKFESDDNPVSSRDEGEAQAAPNHLRELYMRLEKVDYLKNG